MLKDNMTIPPAEANQIIRDLGRIEADMLAILAMKGKMAGGKIAAKHRDSALGFAKRSQELAAKLAEQFATLRIADALTMGAPKVVKPRRSYAPKAKQTVSVPPDFSGSFASMLLRSS